MTNQMAISAVVHDEGQKEGLKKREAHQEEEELSIGKGVNPQTATPTRQLREPKYGCSVW